MRGSVRVEQFMWETLSSLPALVALGGRRVWKGDVPPEAEFPYVKYDRYFAEDHGPIGAPEMTHQTLGYQWVIVDIGNDTTRIEPIAEAIDAALNVTGVVVDGYEIESTRQREIPTEPPREDGVEVTWLGGEIEFWVTQVA